MKMRFAVALFALITAEISHALRFGQQYPQLDNRLFEIAGRIRQKYPFPPDLENLAYPSVYTKPGGKLRGFCNWLIPGKLMVGQYPGQTPEKDGPSAADVGSHIRSIVQNAKISCFACLQSEIPPQDRHKAWDRSGGEMCLDPSARKAFPGAFTRYAPLVQAASLEREPVFLYAPITDLSVPNSQSVQDLLLMILTAMTEDSGGLYLHCWGGRGRAGIVGACLVSLIYPELDSRAILNLVQVGYESRVGALDMSFGLSRSPQTERQREFVGDFVKQQQLQRSKKYS